MSDADAVLVTYQGGPAFLALVNGRLSIEGGVVAVVGAPTIFPKNDTHWNGRCLTLHGRTYEVGDDVQVGGGGAPLRMVRGIVGGFVAPPQWGDDDMVFIVS